MKGCCGEIWFRNVREGLKGRLCCGKDGSIYNTVVVDEPRGVRGGRGVWRGWVEVEEEELVFTGREGGLGLTLMWELRGLWMGMMGKESGKESLPFRPCGMRVLKSWKGEEQEEVWMGYGMNASMRSKTPKAIT